METIPLDPVDAVTVTTLVDNVADLLLADQGPVTRSPITQATEPMIPARFLEGRPHGRRPAGRARLLVPGDDHQGRADHARAVRRRPHAGRPDREHAPARDIARATSTSPQRPDLRADHPADLRRARGARAGPPRAVPLHGWRAIHALVARFPDAFIQNAVGSQFEFS